MSGKWFVHPARWRLEKRQLATWGSGNDLFKFTGPSVSSTQQATAQGRYCKLCGRPSVGSLAVGAQAGCALVKFGFQVQRNHLTWHTSFSKKRVPLSLITSFWNISVLNLSMSSNMLWATDMGTWPTVGSGPSLSWWRWNLFMSESTLGLAPLSKVISPYGRTDRFGMTEGGRACPSDWPHDFWCWPRPQLSSSWHIEVSPAVRKPSPVTRGIPSYTVWLEVCQSLNIRNCELWFVLPVC